MEELSSSSEPFHEHIFYVTLSCCCSVLLALFCVGQF